MTALAQEFSDKITKEFVFEKKSPDNALIVANINGSIKVEGYEGDRIMVEVNRYVNGKTDARLQAGKDEVQLGVIDRADTIILYVKEGCHRFERKTSRSRKDGWVRGGWGYNWDERNGDCNDERPYDYRMDFTVKVPKNVHLLLNTINEGDITVKNVNASVDAKNINGSIRLTNLVREADVSTINGDVDIEYDANPPKNCRFYTLNGDINALFPKTLAANMTFESFNGEFYTNIENLEPLPIAVTKSAKGEGIKYKVSGNRYQIGKGGDALLDFETFNGNVYLKTN